MYESTYTLQLAIKTPSFLVTSFWNGQLQNFILFDREPQDSGRVDCLASTKAQFPLPKFTAQVVNSGAFLTPVNAGRQLGCKKCTGVHGPSTRAVETGLNGLICQQVYSSSSLSACRIFLLVDEYAMRDRNQMIPVGQGVWAAPRHQEHSGHAAAPSRRWESASVVHPWSQTTAGRWCPLPSATERCSQGSFVGSPAHLMPSSHRGTLVPCTAGNICRDPCDQLGLIAVLPEPG